MRITLENEASCEPYFEGDVSLSSFSSFTFLEIQDFGNHRWRVVNFLSLTSPVVSNELKIYPLSYFITSVAIEKYS